MTEEFIHICMVCFRPFTQHDDREEWPPRCCHGCPCGNTQPPDTPDFPEPLRACPSREFGQR